MGRPARAATALLIGLALAGCGGVEMKPGDQVRNYREIRPGPGVRTGRDGEVVILRVEKEESHDDRAVQEGRPDPDPSD